MQWVIRFEHGRDVKWLRNADINVASGKFVACAWKADLWWVTRCEKWILCGQQSSTAEESYVNWWSIVERRTLLPFSRLTALSTLDCDTVFAYDVEGKTHRFEISFIAGAPMRYMRIRKQMVPAVRLQK